MDDSASWRPVARQIDGSVEEFFVKVNEVWEAMGLSDELKVVRFQQASKHVMDLLSDMLHESQASRTALVQEVQELMNEATVLSKDLQVDVRVSGYEHLPLLEVRSRILNQLEKFRLVKQQRLNLAKELSERERDICQALGSEPIGIKAELPSEEELKSFKLYLDKIEAEKTRMEATYKDTQISIIKMIDELRIAPSGSFENLVYNRGENFILNTANMTKLKELHERLKHQIQETEEQIKEKKKMLDDLWNYLEEPIEKCQLFVDSHTGFNLTTLKAFDEEIKRCKRKRSENISKYVEKVRLEIVTLWNQCHVGEEERQRFKHMDSPVFNDVLLFLHEMEADKLRKYYQDNKEIFELLEVRDNLWQKMENLEQRANDPKRFHNRGGQLLAEEKERNVIQKKLPKIEEEIQTLINEYESKNNKPFTTYGVPLSEALKQSWTDYIAAKQVMTMARKQAKEQSMTLKKTPLCVSKRTPSATSMRRPSPATSGKRKLLHADLTPHNPSSRKRRNHSSGSSRANRSASKIKRRNCRASRRIFLKAATNGDENNMIQEIATASSSTSISSYGEFQEHLENRDELRSSVLPRHTLKSSNLIKSTINATSNRIKTPIKPLSKNVTSGTTTPNKLAPTIRTTPRAPGTPRNPRTLRSPSAATRSNSRLAPAPGTLPFLF